MTHSDGNERRRIKRHERLAGLQALLQTYYDLGIHNAYTRQLRKKVTQAKAKHNEGL